jgi:hypothetical protein
MCESFCKRCVINQRHFGESIQKLLRDFLWHFVLYEHLLQLKPAAWAACEFVQK